MSGESILATNGYPLALAKSKACARSAVLIETGTDTPKSRSKSKSCKLVWVCAACCRRFSQRSVTAAGTLPADVVVLGVGVLPNDGLAQDAGLPCDNGIQVDERCRTADPAIRAIGDCTNHPSVHYGGRVRLESVDNAVEQANTAAADLLGIEARHERVPWFWSDQYEHKLVIVGLSQGHDQVVLRGDPASGVGGGAFRARAVGLNQDGVRQYRGNW